MAMRWLPRPPTKKISAKCAAAHFLYLHSDEVKRAQQIRDAFANG
jgi:hypothetical protein